MEFRRRNRLIFGGLLIIALTIFFSQIDMFKNDLGRAIYGTLLINVRFLGMIWVQEAAKYQGRKPMGYIFMGLIFPGFTFMVLGFLYKK